jgi:SAM-dependent methyltransferase
MAFNNSNLIRNINFLYNFFFKFMNNIKIDLLECDEKIMKKEKMFHSRGLGTVWLLNLKRLYNIFSEIKKKKNYHFIDIGCGNGIPLIYAYRKFSFKSYSGIDFQKRYIKITKKNIESSLGKEFINKKIKLFFSNASNFILDKNKSYFIFMFNPFDGFIMKKFIKNNIKNLIKNNSVVAYCNYLELDQFKKYPCNFHIIKKYKLALIHFGIF